MSDAYREGHERGRTDAEEGKARDSRPPIVKAVIRGKDFTTTYIEGYKEGYRQQKKR